MGWNAKKYFIYERINFKGNIKFINDSKWVDVGRKFFSKDEKLKQKLI